MNVYVASSWRNKLQPEVVARLQVAGHTVYDFRDHGFQWSELDEGWEAWGRQEFKAALETRIAVEAFKRDIDNLVWARCTVLVLPAGRSAHLEFGFAMALSEMRGLHYGLILMPEPVEPELMYRMADRIVLNIEQLVSELCLFEDRLGAR